MERKCDGRTCQAITVDVSKQRDSQLRRINGAKLDLIAAAALAGDVAGAFYDILIFKGIFRTV